MAYQSSKYCLLTQGQPTLPWMNSADSWSEKISTICSYQMSVLLRSLSKKISQMLSKCTVLEKLIKRGQLTSLSLMPRNGLNLRWLILMRLSNLRRNIIMSIRNLIRKSTLWLKLNKKLKSRKTKSTIWRKCMSKLNLKMLYKLNLVKSKTNHGITQMTTKNFFNLDQRFRLSPMKY
jgi:hypothetical protein